MRLIVRGNAQRYFVHLRTGGTLLPWQYYQAGFEVTESWSDVRLPLDAFKASGALLRDRPEATSLTSVAVVAYGRDHDARIDVREVGFNCPADAAPCHAQKALAKHVSVIESESLCVE